MITPSCQARTLLCLFLFARVAFGAGNDPLDTFVVRNSGITAPLYGTAFGNGVFVAVGGFDSGRVLVSPTGVQWSSGNASSPRTIARVVFNQGLFVAGAKDGIWISGDGTNWGLQFQFPGYGDTANVAATTNSYVVASSTYCFGGCPHHGSIYFSTNGFFWSGVYSGNKYLTGVTSGHAGYVAVGMDGAALISTNGINWESASIGTTNHLYSVACGNGYYATLNHSGSMFTSTNGRAWVQGVSPVGQLGRIAFVAGRFIATWDQSLFSSSNLLDWTSHTFPSASGINWMTAGTPELGIVAVGVNGTILQTGSLVPTAPFIVVSPTNQNRQFGGTIQLGALALGSSPLAYTWQKDGVNLPAATNTSLVITNARPADSGDYRLVVANAFGVTTSSVASVTVRFYDPLDRWSTQPAQVGWDNLYSIAYGNGIFVAGGSGTNVLISTNGRGWTLISLGTNAGPIAILYTNSQFIAVGSFGRILRSPDGRVWERLPSASPAHWSGLTYGNGRYVAVGASGTVAAAMISTNGTDWLPQLTSSPLQLTDVAYGNGLFVAVSHYLEGFNHQGGILTSPDGISWTNRTPSISNALNGITYSRGLFVAVGNDGAILTSSDANTWTPRVSGTSQYLNEVIDAEGDFMVVGYSSVILSSPDGIVWNTRVPPYVGSLTDIAFGNQSFVAVGGYGPIYLSDPIVRLRVKTGPTPELLISSPTDRACRLEFSTPNEIAGAWFPLTNLLITTNPFVWSDAANQPARLYRLVLP
jgi:hypothetical protein